MTLHRKKFVSALAILSVTLLCACGGSSDSHPTGDKLNSQLESIGQAVISQDSTLPEMTIDQSGNSDSETNFTACCDADYSTIAGYYHAYASDGTAAEITIICADSSDDVSTIEAALKDHMETRKGTMESYSPDQVEIVEKGIVTHQGCYVALFIGEKSGLDKNNFLAELEDNGIQ